MLSFKNLNLIISKRQLMNIHIPLLLILAIWSTCASQNTTTLILNQALAVVLPPQQSYQYQILLPAEIPANNDFFFVVQQPSGDPLQYPFIDISINDGYRMTCYNSNDQFSGVCKVSGDNLLPNTTIIAQIYCFVECKLTITPLLSKRLKMSLTDSTTFTAPKNSGLPLEIQMQVPYDINYTQIAVYAQIDSFEKANQGLEMYANIGDQNQPIPTKISYNEYGQSIYWGGKGIFLSKEDIKPGQWIKLYIYISEGMQVKIFSNFVYGNSFMIDLGKSYFDFTSYQENKIYIMDLQKMEGNITGNTITISFLVYSGNPYITIAMDNSFLKPINERGSVSTSTYLITQSLRKEFNYTGVIYIKVQSSWSSDYLIYTGIDAKNYINIFPDISLYNELQPKDLYNYFFDDIVSFPSNSTIRSYSIRVDMIRGHTTFGIRRCRSAQESYSILNCVINDTTAVKNKSVSDTFQEISITMKKSENYYYMSFQYDAQQCTFFNSSSKYYCSFQIVALQADNITSDYTITLNKRLYTTTLMEGSLAREFIYKGQYLYFRFILGSLDEVVSVTFYITLIEGDIYLIGSTMDEFPNMNSNDSNIYFSVGNYLVFNKDDLAKTIYVSTYGIELSQFTLGVKVIRKSSGNTTNSTSNNTSNTTSNKTSHTKLTLKLDLSQEFILEETDTDVIFLISTPTTMNVTVQIMQLAGTVNLQLKDKQNTVNCSDSTNTNNKVTCTFLSTQKVTYNAIVTKKAGDTQKFIILYHKKDVCITYSLNLPLYIDVRQGVKTCILYTLTKIAQLEVTSTVPLVNLLDQTLHMVVCLNENCLAPTLSHHLRISKSQLISYCKYEKVNNTNVFESCSIEITFASNVSLSFEVIVEEQGKDIGLFDGIVEKINSYDLSHQKGRYFFYEIYQWSAVKIFFTSLTGNSFYMVLHFVQQQEFLKNSSNIYLPYRASTYYDLKQKFETNFYEAVFFGSNTNIITISSAIVDKYCDECFLTISLYPLYADAHTLSYFQIEVSQTETMLFIGTSKIGNLQSDEIYNYQIQLATQGDTLLTIKDLSRESSKQQNCFAASLTSIKGESPTKIENGLIYIEKGSKMSNLYVEALSDYCSYEVSYMSVDYPLIVATSNRKYQFKRDQASKMFMLYTHTSSQSFKIIQIINTGSFNVYATPTTNQSITQLLNSNPQNFTFVDSDNNGALKISNTSSNFCWNCQYLIVLETKAAISSQVVIANFNSSIALSINGIIKQKIVVTEQIYRNYTFNSISAFNISLNPIYGKIRIIVIDPSKIVVLNTSVSSSAVFRIPHNNKTEEFTFDYNSYFTRYEINIEGQVNSSYTIKASKQSINSRLFQGIPLYYPFNDNETINIEFLNLNSASSASNSLTLLVNILELKTNNTNTTSKATITATFQSQEGGTPADLPLNTLIQAENVYNVELPLKVGTYYIKMTLDKSSIASIILVKQSLIHLKPSNNAIMFKEGVFELYTIDRPAMIEIFSCWGDINVEASSSYKDFSLHSKNYGQIILQQNNYGGHYVINVDNVYGEYFIKVTNRRKQQADIGYLITYYYYDAKDVLPYKLINLLDREITYSLTKTAVTFTFDPIVINWDNSDSIDSVFVQYRLHIADNKNKVGKFANCRMGDTFWTYAEEGEESVSVSVDISQISEIVGDLDIYFVGAQALVWIEPSELANDDYPKELNLIYDIIELSNVKMPISAQQSSSYSAQMIILWFLLPFAFAGVILYFALKYCIRKYRGLLPNELMEEGGESEQGVNLPDHSPFANNPNNASQALKDEV